MNNAKSAQVPTCYFSIFTWTSESNDKEKLRAAVTNRPANYCFALKAASRDAFPHCLSQEDDPCFTVHGRISFLWLICHKLMISRHSCCRSEGMLREREADNFSISHLNF